MSRRVTPPALLLFGSFESSTPAALGLDLSSLAWFSGVRRLATGA